MGPLSKSKMKAIIPIRSEIKIVKQSSKQVEHDVREISKKVEHDMCEIKESLNNLLRA